MAAVNVITPYGAGLLLSFLSTRTLYLGVGSGIAGGQLAEFVGAPYQRQPFAVLETGSMIGNIGGISFGPAPAAGWAALAVGIFDGATGQAIMVGAFDQALVVQPGFNLTLDAGALTFQFNNPS